jgi:hypothetical protein
VKKIEAIIKPFDLDVLERVPALDPRSPLA